jgi:hypothetical protein
MNMQTVQIKSSKARFNVTPFAVVLSSSERYFGRSGTVDPEVDEIELYAGQNQEEEDQQQAELPPGQVIPDPKNASLKVDPIDPDPRLNVGGTTSNIS